MKPPEKFLSKLERYLRDADTLREIVRIQRESREQTRHGTVRELSAWAPAFRDPHVGQWLRRRVASALRALVGAMRGRWPRVRSAAPG